MQSIEAWLKNQRHLISPDSELINNNRLRLLLEHVLKQNRAWIFAHPEQLLNPDQINQLNQAVAALQAGKPLAYITGEQMFWDLNLKVNSHTLIPRPDTELIIETVSEVLLNKQPQRILDLGTGSGALALVLAKLYPKSEVLAVDKSSDALVVAAQNAQLNQITNTKFQQSNWFDELSSSQFDLIVSNPPYIAADDKHLIDLQHEPPSALIADQNGLGDYLRITEGARAFLTAGGLLVFEHGWEQQQQVQSIMKKSGLINIQSRKDLAGHDRVTFAFNP